MKGSNPSGATMKFQEVKKGHGGVVSSTTEVVFEIDNVEAKELRQALAVVDKYRLAAHKAFRQTRKYSPKESDWFMERIAVKNDKVIVSIEDGMAG